jgi:transcriptional regulator with XRE-family HTH domain
VAASLGAAIRKARERRGLTQADVAHALQVPQTTIARLESGGRADPRFSTIALIAEALGVSLNSLAVEAGLIAQRPKPGDVTERVGKAVAVARVARKRLAELDQALGDIEGLGAGRRRPKR